MDSTPRSNGRRDSLPSAVTQLELTEKALARAGTLKRSATTVSARHLKRTSVVNLPSGRLYKFLGDLCLLAGRLTEAQDW